MGISLYEVERHCWELPFACHQDGEIILFLSSVPNTLRVDCGETLGALGANHQYGTLS